MDAAALNEAARLAMLQGILLAAYQPNHSQVWAGSPLGGAGIAVADPVAPAFAPPAWSAHPAAPGNQLLKLPGSSSHSPASRPSSLHYPSQRSVPAAVPQLPHLPALPAPTLVMRQANWQQLGTLSPQQSPQAFGGVGSHALIEPNAGSKPDVSASPTPLSSSSSAANGSASSSGPAETAMCTDTGRKAGDGDGGSNASAFPLSAGLIAARVYKPSGKQEEQYSSRLNSSSHSPTGIASATAIAPAATTNASAALVASKSLVALFGFVRATHEGSWSTDIDNHAHDHDQILISLETLSAPILASSLAPATGTAGIGAFGDEGSMSTTTSSHTQSSFSSSTSCSAAAYAISRFGDPFRYSPSKPAATLNRTLPLRLSASLATTMGPPAIVNSDVDPSTAAFADVPASYYLAGRIRSSQGGLSSKARHNKSARQGVALFGAQRKEKKTSKKRFSTSSSTSSSSSSSEWSTGSSSGYSSSASSSMAHTIVPVAAARAAPQQGHRDHDSHSGGTFAKPEREAGAASILAALGQSRSSGGLDGYHYEQDERERKRERWLFSRGIIKLPGAPSSSSSSSSTSAGRGDGLSSSTGSSAFSSSTIDTTSSSYASSSFDGFSSLRASQGHSLGHRGALSNGGLHVSTAEPWLPAPIPPLAPASSFSPLAILALKTATASLVSKLNVAALTPMAPPLSSPVYSSLLESNSLLTPSLSGLAMAMPTSAHADGCPPQGGYAFEECFQRFMKREEEEKRRRQPQGMQGPAIHDVDNDGSSNRSLVGQGYSFMDDGGSGFGQMMSASGRKRLLPLAASATANGPHARGASSLWPREEMEDEEEDDGMSNSTVRAALLGGASFDLSNNSGRLIKRKKLDD